MCIINLFNTKDWRFLKAFSRNCQNAGGTAYLVGGAVRSALMGEAPDDFDVEVFGLGETVLQEILSSMTKVHLVGRQFGVFKLKSYPIDIALPRTEVKSGDLHTDFAVTIDPYLPLETAARRRDFTLNAIYFNIETEKTVDPLHGISDLNHRILRHCSDQFGEDPLRVLRAMQFAARFAARLAPETVTLSRTINPLSLSKERFLGEWEKLLLQGRSMMHGMDVLKETGWSAYFPDLNALIDCPQDPKWHPEGDVWTHTSHCLQAFAQDRIGDRDEDMIVGLAVLCHDFGKPDTTTSDGEHIRAHGHEKAGAIPATRFLNQIGISRKWIQQIVPLVETHMRPSQLFESKSSRNAVQRLANDCGRIDRLLRVVKADASGRPPLSDNSAPARKWIEETAKQLDVANNQPKPLLRGSDLIEMGLNPSPDFKNILQTAFELQLNGEFQSREDALKWLKNYWKNP